MTRRTLAAQTPDLVLMDIKLPGKDGYELTREIKANPDTCNLHVIALTAHAMSGDREKSIAVGCDNQDPKSIDFNRLRGKIQDLMEK